MSDAATDKTFGLVLFARLTWSAAEGPGGSSLEAAVENLGGKVPEEFIEQAILDSLLGVTGEVELGPDPRIGKRMVAKLRRDLAARHNLVTRGITKKGCLVKERKRRGRDISHLLAG